MPKFVHRQIARKLILSGQDGADAKRYQEKNVQEAINEAEGAKMKGQDAYLKWMEWSDEDTIYLGRCPDLFAGDCHGDDPVRVYAELCEIVAETVADFEREGTPLPEVRTRPFVAA